MNLLFDFGGVLVDLDKARCVHAFGSLGFDVRPYLDDFVQGGVFARFELGLTDASAFCAELRAAGGLPGLADADILEAWRLFLLDVPADRIETLLRTHRHYRQFVLSNTNPVHWAMARDGYFRRAGLRLEDFFDGVFLSYEMRLAKPDPRIFESVCRGIGCPPGEILFFDDSPTNCEGARRCGLRVCHAPAGGGWQEEFDEAGLLRRPEAYSAR